MPTHVHLPSSPLRLPEGIRRADLAEEVGLSLVLAEAGEEARRAITAYAAGQGLRVEGWWPLTRRLKVRGAVKAMEAAFGFEWMRSPEGGLHGAGAAHIPQELSGYLRGVLGHDPRPKLRPHLKARGARAGEAPPVPGKTAVDFAAQYGFPSGDGKGQHVGLLQLGGTVAEADLKAYFEGLGLPVPSVEMHPISGGDPAPTQDSRWEMTLDVEVVGAVVPAARLTVFVAPNSSDGLLDLVESALKGGPDQPSVLSMSWGGAESEWGALELELVSNALQAAGGLGVTVLISSGDEGSSDGATDGKQHVNFPASSPWVLAVGGTQQGTTGEVVWNALAEAKGATGGGISDFFDLPDWQKAAGAPQSANDGQIRRAVPDVAAHAAEAGGYRVFVDGQWRVLGGTSAAAPLLAGLITRLNAARSKPIGYVNPTLYGAAKPAFTPITEGSNGAYSATTGYSACTGLGVVNGEALMKVLSPGTPGSGH
ncbi:MAG: S8 family serine peptidase [Acidobacteria bacterium]|nr:S8 family serine peptidase [Acidobacteriota bacterium]